MSSIASTDDEKKGREVDEKNNFTTTLEPVLEETEVGYHLYQEAVDEGVTWDAEEEGAIRRKVRNRQRCVSLHFKELSSD